MRESMGGILRPDRVISICTECRFPGAFSDSHASISREEFGQGGKKIAFGAWGAYDFREFLPHGGFITACGAMF